MKMILKNCDIFGKITDITIENGKITSLEKTNENGTDIKGKRVIPGLVDTHVHGCLGKEANDCDLEAVCDFFAKNGTTSFLPTTLTDSHENLVKATHQKTDFKGAQVLGFHIEGPYISPEQKGAQNPDYIRNPSITEYKELKDVKVITIAPELEGAEEFVKNVDCVVSLGHTVCDYETACNAFNWGAKSLTHTCNAMPAFHHRKPGPIGAAIMNNAYVELIADMIHVHPAMVTMLYRTLGADRVCFISDCITPTGLPEGAVIQSGGLDVFVKDGKAVLSDGTIAGSTTPLFKALKKAVEIGIPFEDAVKMASETPAKRINVKKGKIEVGYDADLLVITDDFSLETVIIKGEIYE